MTEMPFYPNILLIAGTSRNVGKTTFAEDVIRKYAADHFVIGLKVTSIHAGEGLHHGRKDIPLNGAFNILEETDRNGLKDTSRMLLAGAQKAFFIQAKDDQLYAAVEAFFHIVPPTSLIVCESGSLRQVLRPGVFLIFRNMQSGLVKARIKALEPLADHLIDVGSDRHGFSVERLTLGSDGWKLQSD